MCWRPIGTRSPRAGPSWRRNTCRQCMIRNVRRSRKGAADLSADAAWRRTRRRHAPVPEITQPRRIRFRPCLGGCLRPARHPVLPQAPLSSHLHACDWSEAAFIDACLLDLLVRRHFPSVELIEVLYRMHGGSQPTIVVDLIDSRIESVPGCGTRI